MFRPTFPTLAAAIMSTGLAATAFAQQATDTLDTVVVTATGYEQNIKDAPASISVITREELEKKSYTDIVDAVKDVPGVYVTGGGSAQDISIRGMDRAYTLFLVDGRPVSSGRTVNTNGQDGGKQIGLPALSNIERIEIIRGPMSSLYGSEAMGGVVNIITRKISKEWKGTVETEFTIADNDVSSDGRSVNVTASGPIVEGLLGLKVNGGFTGFDESHYVGGDDTAESRPDTQRRQGGFEFVVTPNKDHTITFGYQGARQDTVHTPGKSVAESATLSEYRYDKDIYSITHEGRFGGVVLNTYFQRDVSDKVQELVKKETVNLFNTQGTYAWGEHLLTFGAQYKTEEVINETNGLLSALPGVGVRSADRWLAAVFAEMDWRLSDKFSVTTGLRYNHDEFFGGKFSPRVYGVYHLDPQWTLKGGISTGYKQPSLAQSTPGIGSTTGGGGWQSIAPNSRAISIGNPDLKPESSTSFEFGAAFESADRKLNGSVMVFHTDFQDKIAQATLCESAGGDRNQYDTWQCPYGQNRYLTLYTNKNIDKAQMQGLEASLGYRVSPSVKLAGSYTYTRSEQKTGEFAGEPLNKMPKHMVNASVDWKVTPQLDSWVQYSYRSRTSDFLNRSSISAGTPGYGLIDLGVVYHVNKTARLKAGIYNVANKKITNDVYGVVLDGRRATVGLTVDF